MQSSAKKSESISRAPNPWPAPSKSSLQTPQTSPSKLERSPNKRREPRRSNRRGRSNEACGFSPKNKNEANFNKLRNGIEKKQQEWQTGRREKPLPEAARTRDNFYSCYSYEQDVLAEKMSNSLRLDDVTPSPRGLTTRNWETTPKKENRVLLEKMKSAFLTKSVFNEVPSRKSAPIPSPDDRMIIETRRTEMRAGELYLEETHTISFPKTLPPNVHVITGLFPASRNIETM